MTPARLPGKGRPARLAAPRALVADRELGASRSDPCWPSGAAGASTVRDRAVLALIAPAACTPPASPRKHAVTANGCRQIPRALTRFTPSR